MLNEIHLGDCRDISKRLDAKSVNLIVTSPPYALMRKQEYGGIRPDEYPAWYVDISSDFKRILANDGSYIVNIKENVEDGFRDPYVYKTILAMLNDGWGLIDELIWVKPNPYPGRFGSRYKDGWERLLHFSTSKEIYFDKSVNRVPLSESSKALKRKLTPADDKVEFTSPGVHSFNRYNMIDSEDASCSNVLVMHTVHPKNVVESHPAVFPLTIPKFFIGALSRKGDVVMDPFSGSGTTCKVSKEMGRKFIGMELKEEYWAASRRRLGLEKPDGGLF